jgi:hypothetical protein
MTTVSPVIPTGSTDGAAVAVAATSSTGTLWHTAIATGSFDEVYLWATNTTLGDLKLTVEIGGASNPIVMTVPAIDTVLVVPGVRITNSKTVKCFAASASVINVFGNINRYA